MAAAAGRRAEDARGLAARWARGCALALGRWAALGLAVEHGWGGAEGAEARAEGLAGAVAELVARERGQLARYEVEEFLEDEAERLFLMQCEDGSVEAVAGELLELYAALARGDTAPLEALERLAAQPLRRPRAVRLELGEGGNGPSGGAGDVGTGAGGADAGLGGAGTDPGPPAGPDPDGWETVPTRGKRKGRR